MLHLIEKDLHEHSIDKQYYHGRTYNGEAMKKFMSESQFIVKSIGEGILQIP